MPSRRPFAGPNRQRFRLALLALVGVLLLWTSYIVLEGGVSTRILGVRVSSRDEWRPLAAALILAAAYGALARRAAFEDFTWILERIRSGATLLAVVVALCAGATAAAWGTKAASGADSYGYISQADLWLQGRLIVSLPVMADLDLPNSNSALAPHGYRPGPEANTLVPTYAPGLPMFMAGFKALFGACGVYLVVPAFTVLLVFATYDLGRSFGSRFEGLAAALLVACSPIIIRMSLLPMTDVPVAATWTAAIAVTAGALGPNRGATQRVAALASAGALTALTILIRPNLVPLAPVIAGAVLADARASRESSRSAMSALVLFGAVAATGALFVAGYNAYLYGSPCRTGYGEGMFRLAHVMPNLQRYPRWLVHSQTAAVALAVVPLVGRWLGSPARLPKESLVLLYGTIAVTLISYIPFLVFEEWWYLRFLTPAIPAITVAMVVGGRWLLGVLVGR
ncbi:MAG: ArnT family glycosyltransferase, partial [Acidobacteriota bacterium]